MQKTLITSSLFSTTEYKIDFSDTLKITKLSSSGVKTKTHSLNYLQFNEVNSKPKVVYLLALIAGSILLAVSFILFQSVSPISIELISIIVILSCLLLMSLLLISSDKYNIYSDVFTNKKIFKLRNSSEDKAPSSFIKALNSAIDAAKNKDSDLSDLRPCTRVQYETNIQNINNLLNSGMIDEALHKRISKSMHENVFGIKSIEAIASNVVYLNR